MRPLSVSFFLLSSLFGGFSVVFVFYMRFMAAIALFFGIFLSFLCSDQQLLDCELELVNLVLELTALVGGHAGSDHRPGHAAGAPQSGLGRNENVRNVLQRRWSGGVRFFEFLSISGAFLDHLWRFYAHLVLGEQGQVQQNLNRLRVGGHHHNLADAAVEGLGGCGGNANKSG